MNLLERYLNNARNFLKHNHTMGAEGCMIKAYEIVKVNGFDNEEQRDLFLSLFHQVKEVTK